MVIKKLLDIITSDERRRQTWIASCARNDGGWWLVLYALRLAFLPPALVRTDQAVLSVPDQVSPARVQQRAPYDTPVFRLFPL